MHAPTSHRLGFAVKVLGAGGLPSHDTRRWSSGPHLRHSLEHLKRILDYLHHHEIPMYRLPSQLAPYASHPDLPQFHRQVEECSSGLAAIGEIVRERGVRLSSHPGQYTVLNSEDPAVRRAAAAELEMQSSVLETMGLGPEAVVVLHVGGTAGGLQAALDRFRRGLELLSSTARSRLVIENDDRSFALVDALPLASHDGLRVVWDVLHHRCHDPAGIPEQEALRLALDTWPAGQTPKIHYSSPRLDLEEKKIKRGRRVERRLVVPQLRAHADLVDPLALEPFLRAAAGYRDFDLMLEAKAKDLALLRLREQMAARGFTFSGGYLQQRAEVAA